MHRDALYLAIDHPFGVKTCPRGVGMPPKKKLPWMTYATRVNATPLAGIVPPVAAIPRCR
ncbi:MAG: hypothetical protein J5J06_09925 [Phycisphaerae bacterium]|nr:hypothetical protein [Phycisphaerae bacterium]